MRWIIVGCVVALAACAGPGVERYAEVGPEFVLEEYFAGASRGWGMVQDRDGTVLRRFTVNLEGVQEGDEFVLREWFSWDDGEEEFREWRIRRDGEGRYQGRADDVVGVATGESSGNALNWRYRLRVNASGSTWVLTLDDWMFLQPDGVLLNRATMSKFGFRVGEITIAFQRGGSGHAAPDGPDDSAEYR